MAIGIQADFESKNSTLHEDVMGALAVDTAFLRSVMVTPQKAIQVGATALATEQVLFSWYKAFISSDKELSRGTHQVSEKKKKTYQFYLVVFVFSIFVFLYFVILL